MSQDFSQIQILNTIHSESEKKSSVQGRSMHFGSWNQIIMAHMVGLGVFGVNVQLVNHIEGAHPQMRSFSAIDNGGKFLLSTSRLVFIMLYEKI